MTAVAGGGLLSRRKLLKGAALGGTAAALSQGVVKAAHAQAEPPEWATIPGEEVRGYGLPAPQEADVKRTLFQIYKDLSPEFGLSGTPLQKLRGAITPNGLHFEVHHGGRPEIDPEQHRLMIHGLVERPLQFDLASLDRYPMVSRVHFIECAGNGFLNAVETEPQDVGLDVLAGLVSNAEWTGVPLSILMEEAGVKPEGKWVIAIGADAAGLSRSIPMEKIMADGMLALHQNGERIRPEQGYPMRILLPGYEGNMNVKWVTSLQVASQPVFTRDESGAYSDPLPDGRAVRFSFAMDVKSVITHPSGTMTMNGPGLYEISGLAWSGGGAIERVEVSADGGISWADADLQQPVLSKALARFTIPWRWDGSQAQLLSRATDSEGRTQPTRAAWKARYHPSNINHYNAIQAWDVTPEGKVANAYA